MWNLLSNSIKNFDKVLNEWMKSAIFFTPTKNYYKSSLESIKYNDDK